MPDSEEARKSETHKSSGPYREETEPQDNLEALGDGAATEPLRQGTLGEKEDKDTVGTNPKRNENSRPD